MPELKLQKRLTNGHSKAGRPHKVYSDALKVPESITKRDGRVVAFDSAKIKIALRKCFGDFNSEPKTSYQVLVDNVVNIVMAKKTQPTVEQVQDIVEIVLQAAGEFEAAKHYILYRAERAKLRQERPVPQEVKQAFAESDIFFPTQLQKFQFFDKYSRFNYDLGRRETWKETVDRAVSFLQEISDHKLEETVYERLRKSILGMKSTPSMRLLASA